MIIKSITLKNFQLFSNSTCTFSKLNCVTGQNLDSPNESGNGSGKSTLVLRAILFCLYGYIEEGLTQRDLIRFDAKEAVVSMEIEHLNDTICIVRTIPSSLKILLNENEIVANTASIKQEFITEQFGDINFFRQYRCVDAKNGINVLDLGIVSLRKTLMNFIESYFANIRTSLLAKKAERERYSVDKKIYKHYLSQKRLNILNKALDEIKVEHIKLQKDRDTQQGIINQIKAEMMSKEKIKRNTEIERDNAQKTGICPILKKKCLELRQYHPDVQITFATQIAIAENEINDLKTQLENEEDSVDYYNCSIKLQQDKEAKARECLLRLQYSEREKEYKYTKADIMLYDEAIKTLDAFSGAYIKEWLSSLAVIINNLLQQLNISVEFSADKDFLKVKDSEQIMKYDQLSTGQKTFLNTIFKLAILLQQNQTGCLVMDDGLGAIDLVNFKNLISITKTLPFQIITVYQNLNEEIEDVKHIVVERKNGESKIK